MATMEVKMKQVGMARCKGKTEADQTKKFQAADSAFDMWLTQGLHKLFDEVANEPVPEKLLKLIQEKAIKDNF